MRPAKLSNVYADAMLYMYFAPPDRSLERRKEKKRTNDEIDSLAMQEGLSTWHGVAHWMIVKKEIQTKSHKEMGAIR